MGGLFSHPLEDTDIESDDLTLVYIEGNIGSGKTTLLDALEKDGEIVVRESPENWRFLETYYSTKQHAFELQTEIALSMKNALDTKIAVARARKRTRLFVERSIQTAALFARCQFKDRGSDTIAQSQYDVLCDLFLTLYPAKHSSCTIYLKAPVDLCVARIATRQRPGETISRVYLETLDAVFSAFFRTHPHIIVDNDTSTTEIVTQVYDILGDSPKS
jgi:deoxyadenosine/deoxycytidine kinase